MKRKVTIAILIVFCFAEVRTLLPFVEYYANYKYIAQVLCINKDQPYKNCNGKCYLNKQLQKAQESEKQKKIAAVHQEKIPMITWDYQLQNLIIGNSGSQKFSSFYQFSIKEIIIEPPIPPPKSPLSI